ncbi:MAG: tetratricopeptide repeat protein [Sulfuricella sp.]
MPFHWLTPLFYVKARKFGLLLLLLLVFAIYFPGLNGGFLLDDFQNLKVLERMSGNDFYASLSSVIFTGNSGLTRFLPLLTFALQAGSWPGNPFAFKLVNLLIHLANGALVFAVCRQIGRLRRDSAGDAVALLAAAMWLLNPMQISGVLYVVQRMNLMSAFFVLAGLYSYLHGRSTLAANARAAYGWMSGGVFLGMGLAVLCKENGVLLPLFVLVMELTLLAKLSRSSGYRVWQTVFLYFPLLLVAGVIAVEFSSWMAGYSQRDFSMGERLATEAGALLDYLSRMVFPRLSGLGVYHDDYPVTRWPWSWVQMTQIAGIVTLIVSGWAWRKRAPVFSFGVLWFFAGHLLESTVVPLELYFEHRNYLPMLGIDFILASAMVALYRMAQTRNLRRFVVVGGVAWFAIMAGNTLAEVRLWGNPLLQAGVWAREHPDSPRAQAYYAQVLATHGQPEKAVEVFTRLTEGKLNHRDEYANWLMLSCFDERMAAPPLGRVRKAFREIAHSLSPTGGLEGIVIAKEGGGCRRYGYDDLIGLFDALLSNPEYEKSRIALYVLRGRLQASEGKTGEAVSSFEQALKIRPDVEVALLQVKILARTGYYAEARQHLALAESINHRNTLSRIGYEQDIQAWGAAISKAEQERGKQAK